MSDSFSAAESAEEIDLWHYASKYYDPVKAREYYLRTRELKGNSGSSEKLSKESRQRQAEAKGYVRDQINTARTNDSKVTAEAQKARLEKLQQDAKDTRDRIVEKLKGRIDELKANIDTALPKPELNKIPENATPRQKAFLQKQNDKMMSEYNTKRSRLAKKASQASSDANDAARAEIKKVGEGLREAVAKARTDYTAARKAMADKYKSDLKTELQNIDTQVR